MFRVRNFGPIENVEVDFGDLTIIVGPQANGKSLFLELFKLVQDKKHILTTLKKYNYIFNKSNPTHMIEDYFGEGLGGIIKDNTLVVSGPQSKEALEVLEDSCKKKNSEFIYLDRQEVDSFSYKTSLQGSVQKDNGAVAAKALRTLADMPDIWQGKNPVISEDLIKKGLKETVWPARFQTVRKKPLFIIDGAHNVDAAKRLRETVDLLYKDKRKIYIVGMFRDKEVDEVIKIMVPDGDMVLTVATPGNPRALESVRLAEIVAKYNPRVTSLDSVEEAVEMSTLLSDKDTVTIAFGSLAYLGRIIDIMDGK